METTSILQDSSPKTPAKLRSSAGRSDVNDRGIFSSTFNNHMQKEDDNEQNKTGMTDKDSEAKNAVTRQNLAAINETSEGNKASSQELAADSENNSSSLNEKESKFEMDNGISRAKQDAELNSEGLGFIMTPSALNPLPDADTDETNESEVIPNLIVTLPGSIAGKKESGQVGLTVTAADEPNTGMEERKGTSTSQIPIDDTESSMSYLQNILNRYASKNTAETATSESTNSEGETLLSDTKRQESFIAANLKAENTKSAKADSFIDGVKIDLNNTSETGLEKNSLNLNPRSVLTPEVDLANRQDTPSSAIAAARDNSSQNTLNTIRDGNKALNPSFTMHSDLETGSEAWKNDIGAKISWLHTQKISKAEISLHPAEFGAIDITIDNDNDRITVSIMTRNDAAREMLENNLPKLAELLRNSGLSLEQGTVSQHSGQNDEKNSTPTNKTTAQGNEQDMESELSEGARINSTIKFHDGQIDHYV